MKTTLNIIIVIVLSVLSACAPETPQETQQAMYNNVWNPQPIQQPFRYNKAGVSSPQVGRYYGAKDFFNN